MLLATILLTMTAQTAWAQSTMDGVKYIDANGVERTRDGVIVLNGSETTLGENGGTSESPKEVWYICNTNLSYTSTLYSYYYSSVNIILADGVEMKVENSSSGAIYFPGSLGIYGQSTGTTMGKLTATGGSSNGIYANNDVVISSAEVTAEGSGGIYTTVGSVSITGGKITSKGSSNGIYANNDVVISSAEVTATATGTSGQAICASNGSISITGGKITANGTSQGIYAQNDVTIIGSKVTATATDDINDKAIYSWGGSISISDAEVTAEGNNAIYTFGGGVSITGGKITAKGSSNGIYAQNDVVIISAEVTAEGSYGIYTTVGSVSITGGKVTANGTSLGIGVSGTNKNITINGSEVTAIATRTSGQAICASNGSISITGGKVTAKGSDKGIYAQNDVVIISAEVTAEGSDGIYTNGCVTIKDGSIVSSTGSNYGIYAYKGGAFSDSEVTATGNNYAIYTNGGDLSIIGGKVTANGSNYGIQAYGTNKNITISGAEVTATATGTSGQAIYASGGVSITGGKVTANGTSTGIYAGNGGAFSNCTISGEVGIAAYSSAAVTIGAGVEINGYTKAGIKNYGNLTLKALPKFTAGSGATYQDIMLIKRGDLPVIVFEATGLSAPEKKISVGTYQSDASTAITSTYRFTQGYGTAFSDAESGDVVDPKDVFDVSGGTAVYVGTEVMASSDAQPLVAFILDADDSLGELYVKDGVDIDTDIKALEKALSDAEAYCTVRLVKDITDVNTTITVDKEGAPIKLELDHCGISGPVSGALLTINSGTALTIVGTAETSKIENTNTSNEAISNYGTLTINGVTVRGSNGISNDGTLNITDTSVEATNSYGDGICNNGSLTMSSSSVTGNEVGIYNEGSLTLTSGNVKGYQYAISNTIYATACSIGDVTFVAYTGIYIRNDVTFTAWPTFSGTTTNIELDEGKKIILANGIGAPAVDYGKVSVKVFMLSNENLGAAFQFTSGFSSIDGAVAGTLLPCDVFDMVTKQGGTMRVGEKQGEGYIVPVTVAQQTLMPGWNTWIDDKSQAVGVSAEGIATYAVTQVEGDAVSVASLPDGLIQAGMPILIYNGSSEIATVGITTLDNEYFARETSRSLSQALGSSAETSPCFQGTVGGKTLTASDDYDYFGCNGEAFVSLDLPATVAAHRCWLALPKSSGNGGSPSGTRSLTIGFGGNGDGTTGVWEVKEVKQVTDDTWYTLEGLKLSGRPQKKGIYIMNGKKVIIKK